MHGSHVSGHYEMLERQLLSYVNACASLRNEDDNAIPAGATDYPETSMFQPGNPWAP